MSYLALARKWRPRTFSQLVGQDHINKAIIKSLEQQRLHHAYLFTGTRGVGKTSIARLMAKALNCEQGISATSCLKCDACIAIEQGRFIDLIEIDAASKTRVEDTRELLDNVQYAATSGRFKIYLIDEVHMLSQHSFNALLKTLEEPPAHVKFLLATTDPQKLPVTIMSRCLHFSLKHIEAPVIENQLAYILNEEQISFEQEALKILAKAADGSMRDGLSLLDQAIAGSENTLLATEVKAMLGYTQQNYAVQILQALINSNASDLVHLSRQIASEGGHFLYVLDDLLETLHQVTLNQALSAGHSLLETSSSICDLANQLNPADVQLFYQIALKGSEEIHLAPTLAIGFEMTVLRMLTFKPANAKSVPTLAYQKEVLQPQVTPASVVYPSGNEALQPIKSEPLPKEEFTIPEPTVIKQVEPLPVEAVPVATPVLPELVPMKQISVPEESTSWEQIVGRLKLNGLTLNAAENAELINKNGSAIALRVAKGHQSLLTANVTQRLEQALADFYGEKIKLTLHFDETIESSPAQKKQILHTQQLQEAEKSLEDDPFVQQLKNEFSAELVKNSIEAIKDRL